MALESYNEKLENEIISFLTKNFGLEVFTPGFERTASLYAFFVNFFKTTETKIITIGGTNGKGQTAHTLASLFSLEGKKIALWTSPHILSIRERFIFTKDEELKEVSYEKLKSSLLESKLFLDTHLQGIQISFYEFLFLTFLFLAKESGDFDYLILEVGLGGRLDAVNHFDADCALLTSISRDHQSILGGRYDQIFFEKIKISREKKPLFTNFKSAYLNLLTECYAKKFKIDWRPMDKKKVSDDYFEENQKLAWEVFKYFIPETRLDFFLVIKNLPYFKGRREQMTFKGKSLIFIGAHNIDGIRKMLESDSGLNDVIYPLDILVSFSKRPILEIEIMLKALMNFFNTGEKLIVTSFDHPKAIQGHLIEDLSIKINKGILNFVFDWKSELQNSKAQTILVCGSYYFIGEVQRYINSFK